MSNELTTVPAQVVVAKRNKEKLASIGVTEEKVFHTLRRALSAFKVQTVGRERKDGKAPARLPDWQTRLRAIELYITLTSLSPEDVSKTLKGVTIEVSNNGDTPLADLFPSGQEIDSARAKGRSVLEMARALASGVEPPDALASEPLTMPEKTRMSLKEILERRKDSIGERERVGTGKNGFSPTVPLRAEDL